MFLGGSGVQEIAGGKASKSSQTAQILSGLLLVNIMLNLKKPHNNKPKHKKNPNQASAQLWDSIKYCCPVRNQCYHSSAEHAAPRAAPGATGSTFTDRLCQTQPGINSTPGTELGQFFRAVCPGLPEVSPKPGIPQLFAQVSPRQAGNDVPITEQQFLALQGSHRHSDAIPALSWDHRMLRGWNGP